MTHLPKTELVGVLSPSAINSRDIGGNLGLVNSGWSDLGAIAGANSILSMQYLGTGTVIAGTGNGHVWRSTDYGSTWVDLGAIAGANAIKAMSYLGDGIVLIGANNGHGRRSTDYGATWTDVVTGTSSIYSMSYLGNGIVIFGSLDGHVFLSADYGLAWVDEGAIPGTLAIFCITYLENGITIFGTTNGHIWRSANFGATWPTDLAITASSIMCSAYLGNGIVIFGTLDGHIWRSIDFGSSWTDLTAIAGANSINSISYLGNGIVIFGTDNGHVWRSTDYGLGWVDLGAVVGALSIYPISYLGNGVSVLGTSLGHVWIDDVSYKLDECVSFYTPDYSYYRRTGGTNYYSGMIVGLTTIVNIGANADYVFAIPIIISKNTTFDRIAVDVTTACSGVCVTAGANCRLGIYRDTGNVYPGSLIIDAGAVAINVLGLAELVINQPLTAGLYWLFMSYHTPAVCLTPPRFRGANFLPMLGCYNGANVFQYPLEGYYVSGLDYTAGLPVTAPGGLNPITSGFPSPIVALRAT